MKRIACLLLLVLFVPAVYAADSPLSIRLGARHGQVVPCREGFAHTGGGNIDVGQPAPDTVVITMTGVAVAGAHPFKQSLASLQFELDQCLDVLSDDGKIQRAKLLMEARTIGLLRSHKHGGGRAEISSGMVSLRSGSNMFAELTMPSQSVGCGNNLSLNAHEGPIERPIFTNVRYTLNQSFGVAASHPSSFLPCKTASVEFAPDPALDPLWISYWEPFHGAVKKDFGFQVFIRAVRETGTSAESK